MLQARLRLFSIYSKLGYIPWRAKKEKALTEKKAHGSVYMGTREAITPFLNEDAKRTFAHLLWRPGYMIRDYIFKGQHERYLAPFTALLVYYSIFTLLLAILNPASFKDSFAVQLMKNLDNIEVMVSEDEEASTEKTLRELFQSVLTTTREAVILTHLDIFPEKADTPWKESLKVVEGDIRSKGIPLFLGSFLVLWLSMATNLRKYKISFSGAAAASAYVMSQYCLFMLLALLLTFGAETELGLLISCLLLFIDYRQMFGIGNRTAFWLVVKTELFMALIYVLFYLMLGGTMVSIALYRM